MTAPPTVWFDVEDLFHHFRSGLSRPSGIQRLTFEVYRAAQAADDGRRRVRFVRHGRNGEPALVATSWARIAAMYQAVHGSAGPPGPDGAPARTHGAAGRPAADVRGSLTRAAVAQAKSIACLGRFGIALARYPVRPIGRAALALAARTRGRSAPTGTFPIAPDADGSSPSSFEAEARPGDTLLALGSPWFRSDYASLVRWARDTKRLRFGILIHDMVPVSYPEWCPEGMVRAFRAWHDSVMPLCDLVLANSRHTAREVEGWAQRNGIRLAGPVRPVPVGTGFGSEPREDARRPPGSFQAGSYVVFVSTLEARKNHALLVHVWRELLDEERRGLRMPGSVPTLVFAGRVGWLVADLLQQLDNASWLDGRVRLVRDPTDAELRGLYEGCLFSLFPSWQEGWGLPVTEALGLGVPVLCSSAGALQEAGGDLARYFDPGDTAGCRAAVASLLDDPEGLARWRADVRSRFRPTSWSVTAASVLEAARSLG
jgi:glycosyltransferase involved in cell wall biosynthesis